ncbi:MAG: 1-deoxy-D-xylulose-5-phosphate reductoisomerase [Burkholderiaceae bacterium]
MSKKGIAVLGSTGSIGASTLDVLARHPDRFDVVGLSAHSRVDAMAEQCERFRPQWAVMTDDVAALALRDRLARSAPEVNVLFGHGALDEVAADARVDAVMAAIVGAAGLRSAIAAARAGKTILLANKEALVMAGEVFLAACREGGATILPIDSEHNAVFQCLPPFWRAQAAQPMAVERIVLTASGGPFREWSLDRMALATPEQACAHPNWSMGRKISVDSATMMNKGLELIEAHYLFGVTPANLDVVVHPESVIHSMVQYVDGSTLAQLGNPDMRTPISHALGYPDRLTSGVASLSLPAIGRLHFEAPDLLRFPCLGLALRALETGGAGPCVLNAANEVAVEAFLGGVIGFMQIAEINGRVLEHLGAEPAGTTLEAVEDLDRRAREMARLLVKAME